MAEEIRFFLRIAIYTMTITVIYWFLSYEIAGSTLLLSLGLSAIFFVAVGFVMIRHAKEDPLPDDTRPANVVQRTLGFGEPEGETVRPPLALDDDMIPSSSIWPLASAIAALMLGLGLIYGGWMWGPGAVIASVAVWGWVTQLYDRESDGTSSKPPSALRRSLVPLLRRAGRALDDCSSVHTL